MRSISLISKDSSLDLTCSKSDMKLRSSEAVMVLSTSYIPHLNTALVPLERKGPTENNINSNTNTILIILLILILILYNTNTMDNLLPVH